MNADLGMLDANILVYAVNLDAPQHEIARQLRDDVVVGNIAGCLCLQVLIEFYAVVTDARRMESPLAPARACEQIEKYIAAPVRMIHRGPGVAPVLLTLLARHRITRQAAHDAALVATMLANGVTRIFTANTKHFAVFNEIEVIDPFQA